MEAALNTSYEHLSAGTRVEILSGVEFHDDIGWITVRTRNKPSHYLIDCGFPRDGIFDIEFSYLTELRSRVDMVPAETRYERRAAKRVLHGLMQNG